MLSLLRRALGTLGLLLRRAVLVLLLMMLAGVIVAWIVHAYKRELDSSLVTYPAVGLLLVVGGIYGLVSAPLRRKPATTEPSICTNCSAELSGDTESCPQCGVLREPPQPASEPVPEDRVTASSPSA
jgi:hypothetical protein